MFSNTVSLAVLFFLYFAFALNPLEGAPPQSQGRSSASLRMPADPPTVHPVTNETRGDIYMARKMYREAIDMYRICPMSAPITNKIGIAFQEMSELDLAKKYYERAIRLDPDYPEAINNLGTLYYCSRSYKKAAGLFKRSLRISGPIASVYANLGAAYFGKHDYKNSSASYEEALRLDPEVLEGRNGFGTRIQDTTVTDVALFHLYLAKFYAKEGSDDRALVYLRKSMEEGLKNRKNLAAVPEFYSLRKKPEFLDLLAQNPKPL
jgi:tetratricopeptide (TPR) repeat protein